MLRVVLVVTLLINLIACSSTPEWKGIYSTEKKEVSASSLEVPPDLSQPSVTNSLNLPNIGTAGSTYSAYSSTDYKGDKIASANPKGVKVIRDGDAQWLQINSSPEKVWPQLGAFFKQVGFEVKREDKELGVMETNWLENRIDIPTNWFARLFKKLYSSGLMDKYRARLEKTDDANVTLLFITHQGLEEVGEENEGEEIIQTVWQPRKSDPELEAEMYQRFLIFRDVNKASAIKLVSKTTDKQRTRIIEKDETKMLLVEEGFARTWRRVGIALDRIGLFVEDRNRSSGLYYLRITEGFQDKIKEDKNWLASLFSGSSVKLKERYLLSVANENGQTIVSIYETTGAKADIRFVEQLLNDLKTYLD